MFRFSNRLFLPLSLSQSNNSHNNSHNSNRLNLRTRYLLLLWSVHSLFRSSLKQCSTSTTSNLIPASITRKAEATILATATKAWTMKGTLTIVDTFYAPSSCSPFGFQSGLAPVPVTAAIDPVVAADCQESQAQLKSLIGKELIKRKLFVPLFFFFFFKPIIEVHGTYDQPSLDPKPSQASIRLAE